jgi:hypothetical protein
MISHSQFRTKLTSTLVMLSMYLVLGVYSCTTQVFGRIASEQKQERVFKKAATELSLFDRKR